LKKKAGQTKIFPDTLVNDFVSERPTERKD